VSASVTLERSRGNRTILKGGRSARRQLRRDRLLRWITGVRAVLLAAAALLAAFDQPPAAVIAAGAASSSLAGTYRPLQAGVLPGWCAREPSWPRRMPSPP